MWLLAVSLPLVPAVIAVAMRYRSVLGTLGSHVLHGALGLCRRTPCVRSTHAFVFTNCTHGNPQSVLESFHLYAQTHASLSIGPQKGEFLEQVVQCAAPHWVLELGTHCGYASVRILRALAPSARLYTVEQDPVTADAGEEIILVAGFKHHQFKVQTCPSAEAIPHLRTHLGDGLLDLVLMDHGVEQYMPDLTALTQAGLLAPGCVLLVNNTQLPGARGFLEHIRNHPGRYSIHGRAQDLLELTFQPPVGSPC